MPCGCCQRSKEGPGYTMFDPACHFCGARLIWRIQRLQIMREDKIRRCRVVLADWMTHGHSEMEIRRLAKLDAVPLAPESSPAPKKNGA